MAPRGPLDDVFGTQRWFENLGYKPGSHMASMVPDIIPKYSASAHLTSALTEMLSKFDPSWGVGGQLEAITRAASGSTVFDKSIVKALDEVSVPAVEAFRKNMFGEVSKDLAAAVQPGLVAQRVLAEATRSWADHVFPSTAIAEAMLPQVTFQKAWTDALGSVVQDKTALSESLAAFAGIGVVTKDAVRWAEQILGDLDIESFAEVAIQSHTVEEAEAISAVDRIIAWVWNALRLDDRNPDRVVLCIFVWLLVMTKVTELALEQTEGMSEVSALFGVSALWLANRAAARTGQVYDRLNVESED